MLQTMRFKGLNGARAVRRWAIPYLYSRLHATEFRPVLCYLYTEWRCNIDCHYCFQFDNNKPGMDLETAKSAVDWLKSVGCRVIPLMGGEPLLRKDFVVRQSFAGPLRKTNEYFSRFGRQVTLFVPPRYLPFAWFY